MKLSVKTLYNMHRNRGGGGSLTSVYCTRTRACFQHTSLSIIQERKNLHITAKLNKRWLVEKTLSVLTFFSICKRYLCLRDHLWLTVIVSLCSPLTFFVAIWGWCNSHVSLSIQWAVSERCTCPVNLILYKIWSYQWSSTDKKGWLWPAMFSRIARCTFTDTG